MPSGYVCSNCGAPLSPAQNRCHQCGVEIDWEKAVGRVSYISYLPAARRRRRRRRVGLTGLFLIIALGGILYWGWSNAGARRRLASWMDSDAYRSYQQSWRQMRSGQSASGPTPIPAIAVIAEQPTPAPASAASPVPIPQSAAQPLATPVAESAATSTPTVASEDDAAQARALATEAQPLIPSHPCRAAELLQQAIDLADTPGIEALRQDAVARCSQLTATAIPQLSSPLPAPSSPSQRIAFTAYDVASDRYSIRSWRLDDRLPGADLAVGAMQPAFGPEGAIAYRSGPSGSPGIFLLQADGSIRQLTKRRGDMWPRWAPDGRQILFTSATRSADGSPHIYLVDVATRAVEDLGPGQHADWSQVGGIIFHDCDLGGERCGLWLMDPLTLERGLVTDVPDDSNPVWSPDGRYVAFMSSGRSQSWDVFILDLDRNAIQPVASHPAEDGLPAWAPDSSAIAFLSNREGDWAIYAWRTNDLTTTPLFPVGAILPNWDQAGLDWGR